ncbi:MAG: DegT/DnrJ/EryC1/StrS family aminotransferase, partial [Longimicrobiales bacterium]
MSERFAADGVYLTGSGTQALQLAIESVLHAQGEGGGAVALPAYNCFDLITAAVGTGARVRFYDVDPVTLTPDAPDLERVLDAGVAAVIVAPVFGYQPDWDALRSTAHGNGATLIEDAAQGQGSQWRDRAAGSFGDLSVLSFGRGKGWTAGGGGALLTRAVAGAPDTGSVRRPGQAPAFGGVRALALATVAWALGRPSLFGLVSRV